MGRAHVVVRARIRTIFFRRLPQDGLVRARIRTIFFRRLLQDGLGHEGEAWRCRARSRHLSLVEDLCPVARAFPALLRSPGAGRAHVVVRARIRTRLLRRLLQDGLGHDGEAWRCRERRRHLRLFGGSSAERLDRNLERNLAALEEDLRAVREVRLNGVALSVPLEALRQALHVCGDDDGVAPAAAARPHGLVHDGLDHASSLRVHKIGKRISHVVRGIAVPRHVDVVERLLRHVAFQLGHEVAPRELTRDVAEHECRLVSPLLG
mmetsp:Transcript_82026/g.264780  ORF Transcript_82026/g.264780 Transcript_82026/m.264780 type:complete len:265 (-) Transcript_82026:106-900(-)